MRELQLVMPMGGFGRRFQDAGITTPKPLIEVEGRPMFLRALASFAAWPGPVRAVIVTRAEVADQLAQVRGEGEIPSDIVRLAAPTRGAVETVLAARAHLDPTLPVVSIDCDNAFTSPDYFARLAEAADGGGEGVLLAFRSAEPRYSYAEVDRDDWVVRTAEKRPISPWALMGAYGFARAGDLLAEGERMVRGGLGQAPEFYLSAVYNRLIAAGGRIRLARGDFYCFGTPEELDAYLRTGQPTGRA